jgi:hypothetical protein
MLPFGALSSSARRLEIASEHVMSADARPDCKPGPSEGRAAKRSPGGDERPPGRDLLGSCNEALPDYCQIVLGPLYQANTCYGSIV